MSNIAFIDVETTGLPSAEWARVVEIAAVAHTSEGHTLGAFQSYVRPEPFDDRADRSLAYNGVPREAILNASPEDAVAYQFAKWLDNYSIKEVWAYNRVFDAGMLERSGIYLPSSGGCVMRLSRENMPARRKDPPLKEALAHFCRRENEQAHRALGDAKDCAAVYFAIQRAGK